MKLIQVKKTVRYIPALLALAGLLAGCLPSAPTISASDTPTPGIELTPTSTSTVTPLPSETPTIEVQEEIKPTKQATFIELTEEDFLELTDAQRQELWNKAPSQADGLIKSNVSTILNYLVIYRDKSGNAKEVLNLLNNKKSSLLEAGIAEFDLGTKYSPEWYGKKGELRAFASDIPDGADAKTVEVEEIRTIEEMLEYMVKDGVKWGDFRALMAGDLPKGYKYPHINIAWYIPDLIPIGGMQLGPKRGTGDQDRFETFFNKVSYWGEEGTIVFYKSPESEYGILDRAVLITIPEDRLFGLLYNIVAVPSKP